MKITALPYFGGVPIQPYHFRSCSSAQLKSEYALRWFPQPDDTFFYKSAVSFRYRNARLDNKRWLLHDFSTHALNIIAMALNSGCDFVAGFIKRLIKLRCQATSWGYSKLTLSFVWTSCQMGAFVIIALLIFVDLSNTLTKLFWSKATTPFSHE